MAQRPSDGTLFHLMPGNELSVAALGHPDNRRFVSMSRGGKTGLEIGFHVSSSPGTTIARIGRDTDLILRQRNISAVHVAFEIHPETRVVLLSVRSKQRSSVSIEPDYGRLELVDGSCILPYSRRCIIEIQDYRFELFWNGTDATALRRRTIRHYEAALLRQAQDRSRHLPTEGNSELQTWHNTRIQSARRLLFREAKSEGRVAIGGGQFGTIFQAVDCESGNLFAIKVIDLTKFSDREHARAVAHREAKTLEALKHIRQKHIIELLGVAKFDGLEPEIYMPLRPGNLRQLAANTSRRWDDDQLAMQVLEQMLSALDHLDCKGFCHRDVKPENILCYSLDGTANVFQLADFSLANHCRMAVTKCGTAYYEAPELYPEYGSFPQSSKMDVWSLFATVIDIHHNFAFPPKHARTYSDILQAVRQAARSAPDLVDMAHEDPERRASAAQLLMKHFDGRGLSTPKSQVPPINAPLVAAPRSPAAVGVGQTPPADVGPQARPIKRPADNQVPYRQMQRPSIISTNNHRPRPGVLWPQAAGRVMKKTYRPSAPTPAGPSGRPNDKGKGNVRADDKGKGNVRADDDRRDRTRSGASVFDMPGRFPP